MFENDKIGLDNQFSWLIRKLLLKFLSVYWISCGDINLGNCPCCIGYHLQK